MTGGAEQLTKRVAKRLTTSVAELVVAQVAAVATVIFTARAARSSRHGRRGLHGTGGASFTVQATVVARVAVEVFATQAARVTIGADGHACWSQ